MTLTKSDIIDTIAQQDGFNRQNSEEINEIILKLIKSTLEFDQYLLISGFENFCVKK